MASASSQPQFRYTQPPSKVNLPWECSEDELVQLGKPCGKVVSTKCNVGANKNQAFIEFVFSAFGFEHKITTFEKTAGFRAPVQFSDAETASSAKNALDG